MDILMDYNRSLLRIASLLVSWRQATGSYSIDLRIIDHSIKNWLTKKQLSRSNNQ